MMEEKIKSIRLKLMQYQTQIKVLIHNHKILKEKELLGSEDCQTQISQIEDYLIKLSQKQSKAIVKLKELELATNSANKQLDSNKSCQSEPNEDDKSLEKSCKKDEEISDEKSQSNQVNSLEICHSAKKNEAIDDDIGCAENTSSSSPGELTRENSLEKDDGEPSSPDDAHGEKKDTHLSNISENQLIDDSISNPSSNMVPPETTSITVKDRMAIVRGMRRYGKRRGVGGKPYNSKRGSRRASPSPTELSYKNEDKSEEAEEMDYLNNSKYRGHVFQTDKIGLDKDVLNSKLQSASNAKIDERFYPKQIYNLDADKGQYLLNLGLISEKSTEEVYEQLISIRDKKREVRNLTYVPEIRDRKLRVGYSYLAPDVTSPPMLRARQGGTQEGVRKSSRSQRFLMEEFNPEELS